MLAVSIYLTLNRQQVLDAFHFWTYHPTAEVTAVAQRTAFTDSGLFTFYAVRPEIETGQQFNTNCGHKEQGTAILGCYVNDHIYLYNVTDSRLNGIKEVTAAHEMLHAVYQRMSEDERTQVNALVESEYKKLSNDPAYTERMAFYARTEPGERDNELHSIIGTEVANISPELEQHYAKYFNNRQQVVQLFNSYNSVFLALDKQAKTLSAQLDALSKKIDSDSVQYNADVKNLNQDISDFNQRAATGQFSSESDFSAQRQALQRRVDGVNSMRTLINNEIDRYETLRKQYNETVTESNNLYQSIDSTLAPAPQV